MKHHTFRDAVAQYLRAHPNEWVNAYALMQIGGALAFRTRVSECRTQLAMDITNDVRRDQNGVAQSLYKFIPRAEPSQPSMFQQGHV